MRRRPASGPSPCRRAGRCPRRAVAAARRRGDRPAGRRPTARAACRPWRRSRRRSRSGVPDGRGASASSPGQRLSFSSAYVSPRSGRTRGRAAGRRPPGRARARLRAGAGAAPSPAAGAAAPGRTRASGRTSPGRVVPASDRGSGTACGRERRCPLPGCGRSARGRSRRPARRAGSPAPGFASVSRCLRSLHPSSRRGTRIRGRGGLGGFRCGAVGAAEAGHCTGLPELRRTETR